MPAPLLALVPGDMRTSMEGDQGAASISEGYQRFLADELLPVLRGAHPVAPGPAAIKGSSMGGLASLAALAEHPAAFARAGCVSTHWPVADPRKAERAEPARAAVRTYLARALGAPRGRPVDGSWRPHTRPILRALSGERGCRAQRGGLAARHGLSKPRVSRRGA